AGARLARRRALGCVTLATDSERLLARFVELEDAIEHRDLEDPTDIRPRDDQLELAACGAQTLHAPEQHTERHRVHERRLAEVDDHPPRALVEQLGEPI